MGTNDLQDDLLMSLLLDEFSELISRQITVPTLPLLE
jgi:hypothetical protein